MAKRGSTKALTRVRFVWLVLAASAGCGSAAPSNSLQGPLSFKAVWAAFQDTPLGPYDPPQEGALKPAMLLVMETDANLSDSCTADGGFFLATAIRAVRLVLVSELVANIAPATFTVFADPRLASSSMSPHIGFMDVATYTNTSGWIEDAVGTSGSVHLSDVGADRASGDFNVTLLLPDGGLSSLSGSFDATCPAKF